MSPRLMGGEVIDHLQMIGLYVKMDVSLALAHAPRMLSLLYNPPERI